MSLRPQEPHNLVLCVFQLKDTLFNVGHYLSIFMCILLESAELLLRRSLLGDLALKEGESERAKGSSAFPGRHITPTSIHNWFLKMGLMSKVKSQTKALFCQQGTSVPVE